MTHYNHCVIGLKNKETKEYKYYYKRIPEYNNLVGLHSSNYDLIFLMAYGTKKRALEMAEHFNYCHLYNGNSELLDFKVHTKYNAEWLHKNSAIIKITNSLEITFDLGEITKSFTSWIIDEKIDLNRRDLVETIWNYVADKISQIGLMNYATSFYQYSDELQFDYDKFNDNNDNLIVDTLVECLVDYWIKDNKNNEGVI